MLYKDKNKHNNLLEKIIYALLFCGILSGSAVYLFQVNIRAASAFKISELDKKTNILEEEVKDLKIKSAKMQSIGALEEHSKKMGMERMLAPEFIEISGNVALK